MKYSEDKPANLEANNEYIKRRWEQLYGLERESSTEGIKYLFLVNSGASVAVLAFFGSVPAVRDLYWPKVMLFLFVVGLILVGVLHIVRHRRMNSLFMRWVDLVNKYYSDAMGWSEVVQTDTKKSAKFIWIDLIAYMSFSCFVAGAIVGMGNFSTLTSGESNVGKEAITAPAKANTHTDSSAGQTIDQEHAEPLK